MGIGDGKAFDLRLQLGQYRQRLGMSGERLIDALAALLGGATDLAEFADHVFVVAPDLVAQRGDRFLCGAALWKQARQQAQRLPFPSLWLRTDQLANCSTASC